MTKKNESHELSKADQEAVEELKKEAEVTKDQLRDEKTKSDTTEETPPVEEQPTAEDKEAAELSKIEAVEFEMPEGVDPDQPVTYTKPLAITPWWKRPKWIAALVAGAVVVLVFLLLLIPVVRYVVLGNIWQRTVTIAVYDTTGHAPLRDASVTIDATKKTTDASGKVSFTLPLGMYHAIVKKANYSDSNIDMTVDVLSATSYTSDLVATGKQIDVTLTDRVTGQAVANAMLMSGDKTLAKGDAKGLLHAIIPLDKKELKVSITADHYNKTDTTLTTDTKTIPLVPTGSVYFLSKASGKIDVVKANFDGSARATVLAGTGSEDDHTTVLLAARDWSKLMLIARRDGAKTEGAYVIDTASGKMTAADRSGTSMTPIGWSGHWFVYEVFTSSDTAGSQILKAYNADSGKTVTLDQNQADAPNKTWEDIQNIYITDKGIVYTKSWTGQYTGMTRTGKQAAVMIIQADGTGKKSLATYDANTVDSFTAKLYEPQGIYIARQQYSNGTNKTSFGEVENGAYQEVKTAPANFDSSQYPTFLVSPNGKATLWSESRDGKNVIFTGDQAGANKQEWAAGSDFKPYGWLGDDKILLQKSDSELYITTPAQLKAGIAPLKVSDYHKAQTPLYGYGYGYGGL